MTRHLLLALAVGVLAVAVAAGAALVLRGGGSDATALVAPTTLADPHGKETPALRKVAILPKATAPVAAERQGIGGVELVRLRTGAVPARPTTGTVLTDEDCAPDLAGVSHCRNDIRLASGATISVVHDHPMATIACLTPGERIDIRAA